MALLEALTDLALPTYRENAMRDDIKALASSVNNNEIPLSKAYSRLAEMTGDPKVFEVALRNSALANLASKQENSGLSSSISHNQEESKDGSALAAYAQLVSAGVPDQQALGLVKMARGQTVSTGGVVGELMDRLKKENPKLTDNQALYLVQTGMRQGLSLDDSGNVVPMGGIINAKGAITAGTEAAKKTGAASGEAEASLSSQESKIPELEKSVSELSDIGKKATYTTLGKLYDLGKKEIGLGPTEGSISRKEYMSKVDNQILPLLRDTFGAQFTENEGKSLRNTLGDPDATSEEKDAVLKSFIEQKKATIESLKRQTGKSNKHENKEQKVDLSSMSIDQLKSMREKLKGDK